MIAWPTYGYRLLVDCRPHLCSYSWVLSVCRLIPCPVMTLSFQDFLAWPVNVMTWFSFVTWSVIAAVFISGIKSFRSARVIMFLSQKGTKTTLSTAKLLSYVNVLLLIDSTTFLCSSCRFNSFYIPVSPMHVDYRYSCGTESCIHHLSVRLCICRSGGLDDFLMPREVSWQCLPVVTEDSFCSLWQPFYMSNAYQFSVSLVRGNLFLGFLVLFSLNKWTEVNLAHLFKNPIWITTVMCTCGVQFFLVLVRLRGH